MRTDTRSVDFEGHRLVYRVVGEGSALVVVSQYWRDDDEVQARLLSDQWQVFHITPVGYGASDRVPGYAGEALPQQVTAVLDSHHIDRFVTWGYSAGGAMAATIARATPRAAGLVCGGYSLVDKMTPGTLRQLKRRLRSDHASRSLWSWVNTIDWSEELREMRCPRLLYWGSEDHQMANKLRRAETEILLQDIDFVEFAGLDHVGCNSREALEQRVVPTVAAWIESRVGSAW